LAKRRETTKELAAGRLDFAMDAPLNTDPQVRHVKLLEDRYICAMRRGHPLAKDKLTLEQYLSLSHIHISSRRNVKIESSWPSAARRPRNWPPAAWTSPWTRHSTPTRRCVT
ncbi:LysR substrate-binding domain-containing protein, partial [Acinetobacter baumannii]|uniref:LysR substrate-binding domain-containing protein n=1 Tax=Acinetobacter baumannii TaxID=470 RepID=UPI00224307AF